MVWRIINQVAKIIDNGRWLNFRGFQIRIYTIFELITPFIRNMRTFFVYFWVDFNKLIFRHIWWYRQRLIILFKTIFFYFIYDAASFCLFSYSISICRGIDTFYWLIIWIRGLAEMSILCFRMDWFFRGNVAGVLNRGLLTVNVFLNRWSGVFVTINWLGLTVILLGLRCLMSFLFINNIHLHILQIQRNLFL